MNAEPISISSSIYMNYMKNSCGFIETGVMTKLKILVKIRQAKFSANGR
jgi:hypothetical protein